MQRRSHFWDVNQIGVNRGQPSNMDAEKSSKGVLKTPRKRGRGRGLRQLSVREDGISRKRGRVRGKRQMLNKRAKDVADAMNAHRQELEERVGHLTDDSCRHLIIKMCERNPSLVFDVLEESSESRSQQGGYHPPPGNTPFWCTCGHCREMPTEVEKVCCQQIPENCFSLLPDFGLLVLEEAVLAIAQRYREDVLAMLRDNDSDRGFRLSAYRQFILWHYGRLGAGNRRVVPSCCVWQIRDKFPDSFGQYTGFKDGRLA